MKTYRVTRSYVVGRFFTKALLTAGAAGLYVAAVTHPTPLALRLLLLAGLIVFGWLYYVRVPSQPTEIALDHDGWVRFRSPRGTTRIHVAAIRSIGRGLRRRSVRIRHQGGRLRVPNRFADFYDFLASVKSINPAVQIKGF